MAQFNRTNLSGQRVLVKGTDAQGGVGETVVSSAQWDEINQHVEFDQASEAFDAAVEDFFAPLTTAADALAGITNGKPEDSTAFVVLHEATEGVPARPGTIVQLSKDSIILRLLDEGADDRLLWVGDQLEVLEATVSTPAPVVHASDAGLGQE